MRDDLGRFLLGEAVVHSSVEVIRDLRNLAGGDQRTNRHQATIPRRQVRTQPQIAEQWGSVVYSNESRSNRAELLAELRSAIRFGGLIERQKRR